MSETQKILIALKPATALAFRKLKYSLEVGEGRNITYDELISRLLFQYEVSRGGGRRD